MRPFLFHFRLYHSGIPWVILSLLLCCKTVPLQASGPNVALTVGHFNADSIADTLFAQRSGVRSFLPVAIHWGTGGSAVARTSFILPSWSTITGSCAVTDLNADSSLDIIFYLKGDSIGQPVARSLVIASGGLLDQQSSINIASLAASQSSPFTARDLVKGSEFTEEAVRDLLGHNSYLLSVNFGSPLPSVLTGVQEQTPWKVSLYPNPTGRVVTVQGHEVTPGEYILYILSLQVISLYDPRFPVHSTGECNSVLDLHTLSSGTYIVRLSGIHTNQTYSTSLVFIR